MAAAQQLKLAVQCSVEGVDVGLRGNGARDHADTRPRHPVHGAVIGRTVDHVTRLREMAGRCIQHPAATKIMLKTAKQVTTVVVPVGPARSRIDRAAEVGACAIAVEQRQMAEGRAIGLGLHVVKAQAQQRVGREICLDDGVEVAGVPAVVVHIGLGILSSHHDTAAHRPCRIQRAGNIGGGAVTVP